MYYKLYCAISDHAVVNVWVKTLLFRNCISNSYFQLLTTSLCPEVQQQSQGLLLGINYLALLGMSVFLLYNRFLLPRQTVFSPLSLPLNLTSLVFATRYLCEPPLCPCNQKRMRGSFEDKNKPNFFSNVASLDDDYAVSGLTMGYNTVQDSVT